MNSANLHDRKFDRYFPTKRLGYGGRAAASAFYSHTRNRKFPRKRNSLRAPTRPLARSFPRFSVIYSRSSRNLPAGPSTRAPRTGYPNSSQDPPFLVLSRASFAPNGYLLYPPFTLTLSISVCLLSIPLPDRSALSWLPRPVSIRPPLFFSFARTRRCPSPPSRSPIARFLPYLLSSVAGLSFSSRPLPIRLVLLTWLLYSAGSVETHRLVRAADWFPRRAAAAACLSKGAQNRDRAR